MNENQIFEGYHASIEIFLNVSGLHKFDKEPSVIIMSDSDSAFQGDKRNEEKILDDEYAELEHVRLNDHHALGVSDAFAKPLNEFCQ